jgi:hypothetical protein
MRKVGLLLAVLVGAVMLVAGSAGAADLYWEVKVSGKGVQVDTDNDTEDAVWVESKHSFKTTVYTLLDTETLELWLAYLDGAAWVVDKVKLEAIPTDKGFLIYNLGAEIGPDSDIQANALLSLKFKGDELKSGKLSSMSAGYFTAVLVAPPAERLQSGSAKFKGKIIDPEKMPAAAKTALDDAASDK